MTNGSARKGEADVDGFSDSAAKSHGTSSFAKIRQGILLTVLAVALVLLAWEYLVVQPGYKRANEMLAQLADDFTSASFIEVNGDKDGQGIRPEFLEATIHEQIGFAPQEVRKFGDVEFQIFRWRRWNLKTFEVGVAFAARGPQKVKVFTNFYENVADIPSNPAGAIETPAERLSGLPDSLPSGAPAPGAGGGGARREGQEGGGRRRRPEAAETETETGTESGTTEQTSGDEGAAADGAAPAGDGSTEAPAGDGSGGASETPASTDPASPPVPDGTAGTLPIEN